MAAGSEALDSVKTPGVYQRILAESRPSVLWGARCFPSSGSQDSTLASFPRSRLLWKLFVLRKLNHRENSPQRPRLQEPGPSLTCIACPKAKVMGGRRAENILKGHLPEANSSNDFPQNSTIFLT